MPDDFLDLNFCFIAKELRWHEVAAEREIEREENNSSGAPVGSAAEANTGVGEIQPKIGLGRRWGLGFRVFFFFFFIFVLGLIIKSCFNNKNALKIIFHLKIKFLPIYP